MSPILISEVFPSKWLSPEDLTRPVVVMIESVEWVEIYSPRTRKTEQKVAVAFQRATKRLILNATQGKSIAAMLGDLADNWPGHRVMLSPATAPNGKPTIAVSRPPSADPNPTPPPPPAPDPDPNADEFDSWPSASETAAERAAAQAEVKRTGQQSILTGK